MGEQVVQEQQKQLALVGTEGLYMGEQVVQEQRSNCRDGLQAGLYRGGIVKQWGLGLNRFLLLPEFS